MNKLKHDLGRGSAGFMDAGCEDEFEYEAELRSKEEVDKYLACALAASSLTELDTCGQPHPIEHDICTRQWTELLSSRATATEFEKEIDLCVIGLLGIRGNHNMRRGYPAFIECNRAATSSPEFEACTKAIRELR